MSDCRIITDKLNDLIPQKGSVITGSTAVDIVDSSFIAETDGWTLAVHTNNPVQQNPVGEVTVGLYVDIDGRSENNAPVGARLGADNVYAIVYENGYWHITRETFVAQTGWRVAETKATYVIKEQGYELHIPFAEVARDAKAFWRAGVAVESGKNLSIDYAPDTGLSCAPTLGVEQKTGIADVPTATRPLLSLDHLAVYAAGFIVIALVIVILSHKRKTHDS